MPGGILNTGDSATDSHDPLSVNVETEEMPQDLMVMKPFLCKIL